MTTEEIRKKVNDFVDAELKKFKIKKTPLLEKMIIRNFIVECFLDGKTEYYDAYMEMIKADTMKRYKGFAAAGSMKYIVQSCKYEFDIAKIKLDIAIDLARGKNENI